MTAGDIILVAILLGLMVIIGRLFIKISRGGKMSSERKKLVKKLDAVFGEFIKNRDGRKCVCCGSEENIQPGHLFTRAAYSTRWTETNCFAQCRNCNFRHEFDPGPLTIYYLNRFGQEAYEELHRKHRKTVKFRDYDLQEMIDRYQSKLLTGV